MHLLGYFPQGPPAELAGRLEELGALREERIARVVAVLAELGAPVDWEDVRRRAAGRLGRPHVAAAMVAAGHVATIEEAFERWLADGRPAHVPSRGLEPADAVAMVRRAGGAPVLAHPGSLALPARALEPFVQALGARGLVGIEVHRPEHLPEQRDRYATIARRLRLIPSGGSDFHRPDGPYALGDTGEPPLPADTLDRLLDAVA
jgi:hypothetical protein